MGKTVWAAAVLMAAGMGLASCSEGQEPAPLPAAEQGKPLSPQQDRYTYAITGDVAGTYLPVGEYGISNLRLKQINIGNAEAFEAWDAAEHSAKAAPLKLVFEDRKDVNPNTGQARTLTLIPVAFDLSDNKLVINAVSGGLGEVRFDGTLDRKSETPLKGQIKIGAQVFENAELKLKTGG